MDYINHNQLIST